MSGGVGVFTKGRTGTGTTQATGLVTTQVSGSTFVVDLAWSGGAFVSLVDSKLNTWTQVGTEITVGGADHSRRYECINGTGGASHTFTVTIASAGAITILMGEGTGLLTASARDQTDARSDTASPFTLAAGLTTTQADEVQFATVFGNTGSNPGTHAESGIGGMTIQTAAEETNGASFFAGCMATKVVSATGTYNPSFTESGATGAAVYLATYKVAAAAGGSVGGRRTLLGVGV